MAAFQLGPSGAPAYAALMGIVGVCPVCHGPVLATANGVWLEPPVVSSDEPAAMGLMIFAPGVPIGDAPVGPILASSPLAGAPAHRIHRHQPDDVDVLAFTLDGEAP